MSYKDHFRVVIDEGGFESLLAKLPIEVRNKAARNAVSKAAGVVAKEYRKRVPVGNTGNLKSSIATKVVKYQNGQLWVGLAGARRPKGSHAHLIDQGHNVYRRGPKGRSAGKQKLTPLTGTARVEGKFDLLAAMNATQQQQNAAVEKSLAEALRKVGR